MASTDPGPGFQLGDVAVPNTVAPIGTAPVVRASDLLGSHRTVDTLLERDNIDPVYRDEGMTVWITATSETYRLVGGVTNADWVLVPDSPGAAQVNETFVPANGQTIFNLANAPTNPSSVAVIVNTGKYLQGTNFTVAGSVVTWLDTPFALDTSDVVEIVYFL